ncbi:unnamed protein product [Wuchereria bancrofti]|uniref:Uncharacterized protein n=1 Tax=Wuchereria bancrofti TaxID=6293 RepID=A0A3P7FGJ7_WUCBA|nr:unnamed protein product [Wuchereria bancrofti]
MLQRNDVVTERVDGDLMVAPCKSKRLLVESTEFKGSLINKLEIERIKAELEVLAHNHETVNSVWHQQKARNL